MNFEQKNGGEHCTADNSPQDVVHCDADENEFAGFILKNLPLVSAVARRFSGRGAEPEELVQAGSVGLIIAAKSFDKTRGVSFARPEGRYALFSLGPGNLKDVSGPGLRLVREVQDAGFSVVWACAPISVRDMELPATVQRLSVYPLARYLRAFDMFVGAAGYNTCCEVAQAQIPSLIVPNTLLADDQMARARMLAAHAPVVINPCETDLDAQTAVRQLLARTKQKDNVSCALALNGADLAAEAIWQLAQQ